MVIITSRVEYIHCSFYSKFFHVSTPSRLNRAASAAMLTLLAWLLKVVTKKIELIVLFFFKVSLPRVKTHTHNLSLTKIDLEDPDWFISPANANDEMLTRRWIFSANFRCKKSG